jgi:hypothetical protein
MRASIIAIAISALAGCGQPPPETPPEVAAAEATEPAAAPGASDGIDGWEIDMTAYDKIGAQLPAFTVKTAGGAATTSESLRGRWTILGVWPAGGAPQGEDNFAAALVSAAGQDPDLDVLMIHPAAASHPWPVMIDQGGAAATALALPASPAYLLIGPDLTIEGYRGALIATPDDGIKSVIRGVAEVRKQIAAPQ